MFRKSERHTDFSNLLVLRRNKAQIDLLSESVQEDHQKGKEIASARMKSSSTISRP